MLIYILIALLPLWVCNLYNRLPDSRKSAVVRDKYLFWTMLPIFLLIAFRHSSIGSDTGMYLLDLTRFSSMDLKSALEDTRQEAGFVVFTKMIGYITSSPQLYQVIYTSIYFVSFFLFARKQENDLPFYFLFFFITLGEYLFFFTAVRQCIAISFCLLSFIFWSEKKYIFTGLFLFLAYTFHHSAILFVIIYPMMMRKVTQYSIILYLIIMYIGSSYLLEAQMFLNEQLEYVYEIEKVDSGLRFLSLLSILSVLAYVYVFKRNSSSKYAAIFFNANIITLFFWFLRLQTRVAERPSFYFLPFSCFLFAYMYKNVRGQFTRNCILIIPFLYFVYRFFTTYITFVPYRTFFSEI